MSCPECQGIGEVEDLVNYWDYIYEGVKDCEVCEGTGKLSRRARMWYVNHEELPSELRVKLIREIESQEKEKVRV